MVDNLLVFVSHHPHLTYFFIFFVSLLESLALVGLLIPGTVVMFGIGALVGIGSISLKPTLVVAAMGAVAGDAISYWLGHYYQEQLKNMWPFNRYHRILEEGEKFFRRHGGKSIFFGRFVGPIRPVIPLVAGIMGMPGLYFTFVNIISAMAWAVAYVVPGVVLGTSLTIAGIVSTRLIVLTLVVISLLWSFFWLSKKIFALVILKSNRWFDTVYRWAKTDTHKKGKFRTLKKIISFLLPDYEGDEQVFFLLLFLFIFSLIGFVFISQAVLLKHPIVELDRNIFYFLQSIRNPLADRFFVAITELGDLILFAILSLVIIVILLLQRARKSALLVVISFMGSLALVRLFKWLFRIERPITHLYKGISSWGYPSGHTAHSAVLFGMLFVLLVRSLGNSGLDTRVKRISTWVSLSLAVTISSVIGFSRLYLGAHWFSDVLGGFYLGWCWMSFWGLYYFKNVSEHISTRYLVACPILAFLVFGTWHIKTSFSVDMMAYASHLPARIITVEEWIGGKWKSLPLWRLDMTGRIKQPLTVQYSGELVDVKNGLLRSGWSEAHPVELRSILTTLSPEVDLKDLPILPRLYGGKFEKLILYKDMSGIRLVLRLWSTRFEIKKTGALLYVGTVELQTSKKITPWITIPVAERNYTIPLKSLKKDLIGDGFSVLVRNCLSKHAVPGLMRRIEWDGTILLVQGEKTSSAVQNVYGGTKIAPPWQNTTLSGIRGYCPVSKLITPSSGSFVGSLSTEMVRLYWFSSRTRSLLFWLSR